MRRLICVALLAALCAGCAALCPNPEPETTPTPQPQTHDEMVH